jgi:hypothetical protein
MLYHVASPHPAPAERQSLRWRNRRRFFWVQRSFIAASYNNPSSADRGFQLFSSLCAPNVSDAFTRKYEHCNRTLRGDDQERRTHRRSAYRAARDRPRLPLFPYIYRIQTRVESTLMRIAAGAKTKRHLTKCHHFPLIDDSLGVCVHSIRHSTTSTEPLLVVLKKGSQ